MEWSWKSHWISFLDFCMNHGCDHRVWPWPWPWPWIFKVKYRICYISAKNGPIATKRKANISIELQASNVTNGFELNHNRDLWILKVKRDLDLWPHTWPWPWIFMVKFWNSCISEWEGRLTFHKGGGSRSFMTMIMTIWWPISGVWIYQIVTGVTSVVGVPSTHLVWNAIREFVTEKLIQLWWNAAANAWSHFCFLSSRDVRLISTQNSSCVALHNVWFDSFVA